MGSGPHCDGICVQVLGELGMDVVIAQRNSLSSCNSHRSGSGREAGGIVTKLNDGSWAGWRP
jgi:hypothetical protein